MTAQVLFFDVFFFEKDPHLNEDETDSSLQIIWNDLR